MFKSLQKAVTEEAAAADLTTSSSSSDSSSLTEDKVTIKKKGKNHLVYGLCVCVRVCVCWCGDVGGRGMNFFPLIT